MVTIMTLQEAETYLSTELEKIGLGYCVPQYSTNLCESIDITWSIEPKSEWTNGIKQNSLGGVILIHKIRAYDGEGYYFNYTNWKSGYNIRRAKNKDLKKLCDNIIKQLKAKYTELSK